MSVLTIIEIRPLTHGYGKMTTIGNVPQYVYLYLIGLGCLCLEVTIVSSFPFHCGVELNDINTKGTLYVSEQFSIKLHLLLFICQ